MPLMSESAKLLFSDTMPIKVCYTGCIFRVYLRILSGMSGGVLISYIQRYCKVSQFSNLSNPDKVTNTKKLHFRYFFTGIVVCHHGSYFICLYHILGLEDLSLCIFLLQTSLQLIAHPCPFCAKQDTFPTFYSYRIILISSFSQLPTSQCTTTLNHIKPFLSSQGMMSQTFQEKHLKQPLLAHQLNQCSQQTPS